MNIGHLSALDILLFIGVIVFVISKFVNRNKGTQEEDPTQ
jgi:hypothetical protein